MLQSKIDCHFSGAITIVDIRRFRAVLFVTDGRFDNFQHHVARPNNLASGFFEINRKPVAINGLNAAKPPVRLRGVANNGAWCKKKIHKNCDPNR
jgi:hypothetical protein